MTYDGATLTMTITDANVPADTFTTSWSINIPTTVGANTAYVGFTAGTGTATATQDIIGWTYNSGAPAVTKYEAERLTFSGSPNSRIIAWSGFSSGNGVISDGKAVGAYLQFTVNVARLGPMTYASPPSRPLPALLCNSQSTGPMSEPLRTNTAPVPQACSKNTISVQFRFPRQGVTLSNSPPLARTQAAAPTLWWSTTSA